MNKNNIKQNYFFYLCYQIVFLLAPLITTPYLSRVLMADGIGSFSFAESIVSYFVLVATLGISTFGQREISYVQDNRNKRSQIFWETKFLEIIVCFFIIVIYIVFAICQKERLLYLVFAFNLLAVLFDVVWFFQGLEELFRN